MTTKRGFLLLPAAVAAALLLSACAASVRNDAIRLGFKASEDERWEEAARQWEAAVAKAPRSVAAHNNLAVAYEKLARWEDARREYEKALALDPKSESVQYNFNRFQENMDEGKDPLGKEPPGKSDEKKD